MSKEQQQVIDFVTHLSTDINPYVATATMMENLVKSPPSPHWSIDMKLGTFFIYVIMTLQACFLIYLRLRIKEVRALTFNKCGLLVINMSDVSGIAYLLYGSLSMAILAYQITMDYIFLDESPIVLMFGLKFIPIYLLSCAFLWVCCCQCTLLISESKWASKINPHRLNTTMKVFLNLFFLCAIGGPVGGVTYNYTQAYKASRKIFALVHQIKTTLLSAAQSYDPSTFNKMSILQMLIPATQLVPDQFYLEKHIVYGIKIYGLALTVLVVIYIPFLSFSLRGLYKRSVSQAALNAAVGGDPVQTWRLSRKIQQERRRLVYHSLIVWASTAIHLPIIIWQIFNSPHNFERDLKWKEITYHGLAIPFSITGNIVLIILNVHSINMRREMKTKRADRLLSGFGIRTDSKKKNGQKIIVGPPCAQVKDVKLDNMYERNGPAHLAFNDDHHDVPSEKSGRGINPTGHYIKNSQFEPQGTDANPIRSPLFNHLIFGVQINKQTFSHSD